MESSQNLVGTFRSWRDPWGFIVCPEVFSGDLFAHRQHFLGFVPAGVDLTGSTARFVRATDEKGRATAVEISLLNEPVGSPQSLPRKPLQRPSLPLSGRPAQRPGPPPQRHSRAQLLSPPLADGKANATQLTSLVGSKLWGEVRSWKGEWGFIVSPKFNGDLFAHKDGLLLDAGTLGPGKKVSFSIIIDGKGRPTATEVSEPAAAPEDWVGQAGVLNGEIKSWKNDWGFIIAPAHFQGDLFVHQEELCLEEWHSTSTIDLARGVKGKKVAFHVEIDKRGRPCAKTVLMLEAPGMPEPARTSIIDGRGRPAAAEAAPADWVGQAGGLNGEIKSWKNDWGFIIAPAHFQGDLFVHQDELRLEEWQSTSTVDLERGLKGKTVAFHVEIDKRGRPCAKNVFLLEAPVVSEPARPASGETVVDTGLAEESLPMEGTIRSWREPWGFIVSPENFNGDLFCHCKCFQEEPQPGQDLTGATVRFCRALDRKGRPRATKIFVLSPGETSRAAGEPLLGRLAGESLAVPVTTDRKYDHCFGQQLQGQIRSWKEDWGFIVAPTHFDGDLFVHKGSLGEGIDALTTGVFVSFEVGADAKGRASARGVRLISEAKDWIGSGARLPGVVRSFKKPWGFLVSPGSFVGDIFFQLGNFAEHAQPVREEIVQPGLEVVFTVDQDKKGKITSKDIEIAIPPIAGKRAHTGLLPQAKRPRI